jgi:hypothetical protein
VTLTRPGGPGWSRINKLVEQEGAAAIEHQLPLEILCMLVGTLTVYGALFAAGFWLYSNVVPAVVTTAVALAAALTLSRLWGRLKMK